MSGTPYTTEEFRTILPTGEYLSRFRDAEKFLGCCRECRNYGKSWGCPPFSFDVEKLLRRYSHIEIIATKIFPKEKDLPMKASLHLLLPERRRLEEELLEREKATGGLASSYVGTCLYCPEGTCTRAEGKPCRHPDRVRPSLEAYGFDIGKTLSELLGIELKWGKDGKIPEYLVLVCGYFFNRIQ